jgi:hypothetical protein
MPYIMPKHSHPKYRILFEERGSERKAEKTNIMKNVQFLFFIWYMNIYSVELMEASYVTLTSQREIFKLNFVQEIWKEASHKRPGNNWKDKNESAF